MYGNDILTHTYRYLYAPPQSTREDLYVNLSIYCFLLQGYFDDKELYQILI